MGLSKVAQVIKSSDISDDTATSGSVELDVQIPAGSIVIGTKVTIKSGFIGDSSCTLLAGYTGDTDAFVHAAINVFAAAKNKLDVATEAGVPALHPIETDKTVKLTFTVSGDMSDVIADGTGRLLVEIFYFSTNVELDNGAPTEIMLDAS
jgi:hypothetical protein